MGVRDISGAGATDAQVLETVQTDGTFEFQQATDISTTAGDLTLSPSSGNVGVGTASPAAQVHLYKAAVSQTPTPLEMLRLEIEDTGVDMSAGHGPAITFFVGETSGSDWGGTVAVVREAEGDADSASAMVFHTAIDDTYPAERMRITSTGNVGVGTVSPSVLVHAKQAATTSNQRLEMLRLEVSDEGVDMNIGHGPGLDFYVGQTSGSNYGGTIAVVKEQAGDANNDSAMVFHTATDEQVPDNDREKMRITSAGDVGIGDNAPGTQLQMAGTAPYVTLQNSTSENTAGGCESKIIFEDHGANALGQIEVSHVGTSDDEKGQLILSTNNDSGLQTALTIDEDQTATFAGNVTCGVDDTGVDVRLYSATASEGVLYDASEDELALLLTTKLKFHDVGGGEEIYASADGHLEINSGTTVDITAGTTIDLNANYIYCDAVTTLRDKVSIDIPSRSGTPATDGSLFHIEGGATFTDSNTAGSGTAATWNMMDIEAHTLAATNSSVTTTNASTLYISAAPTAGTNQTLTNAWALYSNGATKIGGDVLVESSTSDKPEMTLLNTNADANPATLHFTKDSASPAADDELGEISFNGDTDSGSAEFFAKIVGICSDPANGSKDGAVEIKWRANNGVIGALFGGGAGLTLENDSTYGVAKAQDHTDYSDATLKTNIRPMNGSLEKVQQLQAVRYNWIKEGNEGIGFLAQDVQSILPEVVHGEEGDMSISYGKLTTILVEAVKDLAAQVEALKNN